MCALDSFLFQKMCPFQFQTLHAHLKMDEKLPKIAASFIFINQYIY